MTPGLTPGGTPGKPKKPYDDFPLFPHASGRWAKKVRGKLHYFGPWRDPQAALEKWLRQRDYLLAGREPPPNDAPTSITLGYAIARFLASKRLAVDSGELSPLTLSGYKAVMGRLLDELDPDLPLDAIGPEDWDRVRLSFASTRKANTLAENIQKIRTFVRFCEDSSLVPTPWKTGVALRRPPARAMRAVRMQIGPRDFEAREIRKLIKAAPIDMQAMILLGINCGYGNNDCRTLPIRAIHFDKARVDWGRPKTGVPRQCPLWPRTVEALRRVIAARPEPDNASVKSLVFLRPNGKAWDLKGPESISSHFTKLLQRTQVWRRGLGFYSLRRTFETVASPTLDQPTIDAIMGHVPKDSDMSAIYRQKLDYFRFKSVTAAVHRWLFRAAPWPQE